MQGIFRVRWLWRRCLNEGGTKGNTLYNKRKSQIVTSFYLFKFNSSQVTINKRVLINKNNHKFSQCLSNAISALLSKYSSKNLKGNGYVINSFHLPKPNFNILPICSISFSILSGHSQ